MANEHYIGEDFKITIILEDDISSINTHEWYVEKPDGTTFTLTGSDVVIEDDATGEVYTICDPDVWDVAGFYRINVHIQYSNGVDIYSKTTEHEVKALYT